MFKKLLPGLLLLAILVGYGWGIPLYRELTWVPDHTEWEKVNTKIEELYNKYGVRLHVGIDPSDYYGRNVSGGCDVEVDYGEGVVMAELVHVDKTLSKYSDEGLKVVPKDIFLVSKMTRDGYYVHGQNVDTQCVEIIQLATNVHYMYDDENNSLSQLAFDHEIFHSVEPSEKFIEEFNSVNEHCSLISDYACTSQKEEFSEAWSYAVANPERNLEKYEVILKNYSYLLKDNYRQ